MAHRGVLLSPRRQGAVTGSSSPSSRIGVAVAVGISDTDTCAFDQSSGAVHTRGRARSTFSYIFLVTLEGLLSLMVLKSAWAVATPVMSMSMQGGPSQSASASPVHRAMRSGAALGVGVPFFLLAARVAILAAGQLRRSEIRQPRLGFPLPPGLDENAALDLYVIGLGAAVLGVFVPSVEIFGNLLGRTLQGASAVWCLLALVLVPVAVYCVLGALLKIGSPAEGFLLGTRPTKAMWGLCSVGHVALVWGCFYSPDVGGGMGFMLGLVHIVRLLRQVFAYPTTAGAGAGMCDEGGVGAAAEL